VVQLFKDLDKSFPMLKLLGIDSLLGNAYTLCFLGHLASLQDRKQLGIAPKNQ
jgi:hypothetical protein